MDLFRSLLIPTIVTFVLVGAVAAQTKQRARIEVVMPWVAPERPNTRSYGNNDFVIYAASRGKSHRLRYKGRTFTQGSGEFVDKYEALLPPGRYSLRVKRYNDYLLPAFFLSPAETYAINLPISRLGSPDICSNDRFVTKYTLEGDSPSDVKNRYSDPSYKPIQTKLIKTDGVYDAAIHFCHSESEGGVTVFKQARLYYKEYFIWGEEIRIDRKAGTITTESPYGNLGACKNGESVKEIGNSFSIHF